MDQPKLQSNSAWNWETNRPQKAEVAMPEPTERTIKVPEAVLEDIVADLDEFVFTHVSKSHDGFAHERIQDIRDRLYSYLRG